MSSFVKWNLKSAYLAPCLSLYAKTRALAHTKADRVKWVMELFFFHFLFIKQSNHSFYTFCHVTAYADVFFFLLQIVFTMPPSLWRYQLFPTLNELHLWYSHLIADDLARLAPRHRRSPLTVHEQINIIVLWHDEFAVPKFSVSWGSDGNCSTLVWCWRTFCGLVAVNTFAVVFIIYNYIFTLSLFEHF